MLQTTRMWINRFVSDARTVHILCGLIAGAAWISVSAVWWSAYEPLWPARVGFAFAALLAVWLLSLARVQHLVDRIPRFWRAGLASCGFAAWPVLWKYVDRIRGQFTLDWFTQDNWACVAVSLLALGTIFPAVLFGLLPVAGSRDSRSGRILGGASFWGGVAVAFAVLPTTLFSRINSELGLLVAVACMLVGAGISLVLRDQEDSQTASPSSDGEKQPAWSLRLLILAASCLSACALETGRRISDQLVVDSLPFQLMGWSGLFAGLGLSTLTRSSDPRSQLRRTMWLMALAGVTTCWLFPVAMEVAVWSSGTVSQFSQIIFMKGMVPFLILAPWGFILGRLICQSSLAWTIAVPGVCWGLLARRNFDPGTMLCAVSWIAAIGAVALLPARAWRQWTMSRGRSWRSAELAAIGSLMLAAWLGRAVLDTTRSSRLVFNAEAYIAVANGHSLTTSELADRSRLMTTISSPGDQWTLWRLRGCQLTTRRNGIAVSTMTTDTEVCPQNMWAILSAVVPLVVHPQPDQVLCINPPSAVELDSLLSFPVQSLTCVNSDPARRQVLEYQVASLGEEQRLHDGRLEWQTVAATHLARSSSDKTYDVIVIPDGAVTPAMNQPMLTAEFHAGMSAKLNPEGVFCQRMNVVDYGAVTVEETLRSLSQSFRQVAAIAIEGNDLLLLASHSDRPLIDAQLVERIETPHVRRLCAKFGGDWSMLTQLAYMSPERVAKVVQSSPGGNRVLSGTIPLRLVSDTLRWGAKWKEKQELFHQRVALILTEMGLAEDVEQSIARRIQDSQQRIKILTETPDNQWAYRRELKEALKSRPRTTIQKVNNEIRQTFDEYDQRRKDFFLALGSAARQEHPNQKAIAEVEQFAEPYDPLLTDFAHFEAAHLLGRMQAPDAGREYRNWMYCIGYAPGGDQSVRPVLSAMDLLRNHPEIVNDPVLRWEQHEALLDAMRLRWTNRWRNQTRSKYEAADMQHSSVAISSTLSTMDDLASAAGIDPESWKVQRQLWEDTLLSPLRSRQSQVNPQNQLLETVRQEWQRRSLELNDSK